MKRILLLICVIAISTIELNAQGVAVGIKAGLNFANQSLDQTTLSQAQNYDTSTKTGYHFGAYAKLLVTDNFGIQPEVYYSVQSSEINANGAVSAIKSSYLQVPILVRVGFLNFFNIHAGPQFGLILDGESKKDGVTQNIKDDYKSGNFSLAAGLGVELPFGLTGCVRYVKGMSKDLDNDAFSAKNNMIQVSVGFNLISLGK